jgi:hypothetical protein
LQDRSPGSFGKRHQIGDVRAKDDENRIGSAFTEGGDDMFENAAITQR